MLTSLEIYFCYKDIKWMVSLIKIKNSACSIGNVPTFLASSCVLQHQYAKFLKHQHVGPDNCSVCWVSYEKKSLNKLFKIFKTIHYFSAYFKKQKNALFKITNAQKKKFLRSNFFGKLISLYSKYQLPIHAKTLYPSWLDFEYLKTFCLQTNLLIS